MPIGPDSLEDANWLEPYGVTRAFILTSSRQMEKLRPGVEYRLEVDLGPHPPAGAAIWMAWVE
jgi:hypothetical protein